MSGNGTKLPLLNALKLLVIMAVAAFVPKSNDWITHILGY
ncbi:hypothetical protein AZ013_000047 [Citrobacter freundii]|nr:hypothetical protein AZ013_000047 [Citrobacter freundii]